MELDITRRSLILLQSDAVCDFEEESNGDKCGRDPRSPDATANQDWYIDSYLDDSNTEIAIVRCPDHW